MVPHTVLFVIGSSFRYADDDATGIASWWIAAILSHGSAAAISVAASGPRTVAAPTPKPKRRWPRER